jgi:quinol-cytochrome oxidoreductase complex cytochrome b subunit
MLPFVLLGMAILHLASLHVKGSTNPLGLLSADKVSFFPSFWFKDIFGWIAVFILMTFFLFFYPNALGHSDNYIEANPLVTPAHIVPELYFLPFYAILRSVPNKLGGVILMLLAISVLLLVPLLNMSPVRCFYFLSFQQCLFWILVVDWFILGWVGAQTPDYPYAMVGRLATASYFVYFFGLLPSTGLIECMLFCLD